MPDPVKLTTTKRGLPTGGDLETVLSHLKSRHGRQAARLLTALEATPNGPDSNITVRADDLAGVLKTHLKEQGFITDDQPE